MKLNEVNIKLGVTFSKLDGIRILHISDLHLAGRNKKIESYFKKLAAIESDFVMVTGDFIENNNGIEWCIKYLKEFSPRLGTWACIGNHDKFNFNILYPFFFHLMDTPKKNNSELLVQRLKENDTKVLINEKKTININSVPLTIVGVDAPFGFYRYKDRKKFYKEIMSLRRLFLNTSQDEYVILLSHTPDLLKELDSFKINLTLSGHTHGGQIRLPFIGPLVAFSPFQRAHNKGLYNYNGHYLHVSGGLGVAKTIPLRLFCPPEATVLTFKK